ncbi:MAG: class I SAM-dependent methyltransferase, partial [Nocardioides sp.]
MARAELDKQPTDVRRMFDAVARRYDVTNDVLSLGQDRRWRHDVIEA